MNCLKIDILCVGKLKDRAFENRCLEYLKWLSPYAKIRLTELPDSDKAKENAALLRHLEKVSGTIIVLSEDGKTFTSRGFAAKLAEVSTLYVGGGTPTVFDAKRLRRLVGILRVQAQGAGEGRQSQ